jgi:purine-nucleoside phosphorylase
MLQAINECTTFLKSRTSEKPKVGIVLGTGLGGFEDQINISHKIPYEGLPHFPVSTVEGHAGNLIFGKIKDTEVVAMQGRFHFYEGYSMQEIIFPIRVMKFLGIESLFISNASGGMNPIFKVGDLMVINDHINMMPNPLIGPHIPELGPRFPDMGHAYDKKWIALAHSVAKENNIKLHEGCYVAVTGPTYETPREYEFFSKMGADNIGMSTVPEVIAARQMGIRCFALSVITDLGIPGHVEEITHEEVQKAAAQAGYKVACLFKGMLS